MDNIWVSGVAVISLALDPVRSICQDQLTCVNTDFGTILLLDYRLRLEECDFVSQLDGLGYDEGTDEDGPLHEVHFSLIDELDPSHALNLGMSRETTMLKIGS